MIAGLTASGQDPGDDLAVHVGEPHIAASETVGHPRRCF
jgi:hypothetical protein